jgi:hypothetical protein
VDAVDAAVGDVALGSDELGRIQCRQPPSRRFRPHIATEFYLTLKEAIGCRD